LKHLKSSEARMLLDDLRARGVRIVPTETGGLKLIAARGILRPGDAEAVRRHKAELLGLLDVRSRRGWSPWPEVVNQVPRAIGAFDICALCRSRACRCTNCDAGTWATYAGIPLCLRCATWRASEARAGP
jgi:hypothetical protein